MTREDLEVTRWRGFTHAELYAQLHNGPGATASAVPSRRWADLATTLQDISQDMAKAITDAKALWAGAAASTAFAQLGEVAAWAGRTGDEAAKMRTSVEQQADHIGRARAAMPAPGEEPTPQPDPAMAPVAQLLAMQQDHEVIERATTDAARRAFEVMQTYQSDTTSTTDALADFEEPLADNGHDSKHDRHRGGILGLVGNQTGLSGAGGFSPGPDHHRNFWETMHSRGGQHVSQASAQFFAAPEPRMQQVTSLQPGVVTGADPLGSPVTATPQREPATRKGSISGKFAPTPASLDTNPIPGAPPPAGSHVAPSAATGATGGGTADRVAPRRVGEPLIPTQWTDDAAEPANQAKRRRDRAEQEKITESVDGAESEVAPSVIGNGPYRQ